VWMSPSSSTNLQNTVPRPEFRIQLPSSVAQPPYAWEIQLTYPATRMNILGVRLLRADPSGGIVTWTANPTSPPVGCSGQQGTLDVQVVDPDQAGDYPSSNWSRRARGVAVIFQMANTAASYLCRIPIHSYDINVFSIKGYDRNGALMPSALMPYSPAYALVNQDLN
jgi:hypothetical protein